MHRALAAALAVSLGFAADPPKPAKAPAPERQRTIRIPVLVEGEPVAAAGLKASLATGAALKITRVRSAAR